MIKIKYKNWYDNFRVVFLLNEYKLLFFLLVIGNYYYIGKILYIFNAINIHDFFY